VENGLNYNYARDYDPTVGRYGESDPAGLAASINTYAYVDSDPLDFFDQMDAAKKMSKRILVETIRQCRGDSLRTHRSRLKMLSPGTARALCAMGDQSMCQVFQMLGGEIEVPGT
jgi:uncharacterized protein RhaS with RHS repeats